MLNFITLSTYYYMFRYHLDSKKHLFYTIRANRRILVIFRDYDKEKDKKDAYRLWLESGWVEDEKKDKKSFDAFVDCSYSKVVEHNGAPECLVISTPGTMVFGMEELKLNAIAAVTVGRVLRKQGAAAKLLASMLKDGFDQGFDVAGLGMFEQGFYNRLGFATMGYEQWISFDPARLKIYKKGGAPIRLGYNDWKEMHECICSRIKQHGFITLDRPEILKGELGWLKNFFALGYRKNGKLTHYITFSTEDVEHGPYTVNWMSYQNYDQFLELLGIIKSLEDQVRSIEMKEPAFIQMQDFIDRPFQLRMITEKGKKESTVSSIAYQQLRICNLKKCIEKVHYEGKSYSFNLSLTDPLLDFIEDENFKGSSGNYTVSIGEESSITEGLSDGLPLIKGSINGFSRLWIGVISARTISLSEDLQIDKSLIQCLDKTFYRPDVKSDWDY